MNLYISAAYSRAPEVHEIAARLTHAGITVKSSWHDRSEPDPPLLEKNTILLSDHANCDILDLQDSDTLLCITEPPGSPHTSGGRHVELGWAIATGLTVYRLGRPENIFHLFADVLPLDTLDSLIPTKTEIPNHD